AAGRERDQVCSLAAGGGRADQPDRPGSRQPPASDRRRHRPRPAGPAADTAALRQPQQERRSGLDRRRSRQHPRPPGADLRRRPPLRHRDPARAPTHGHHRSHLRGFPRARTAHGCLCETSGRDGRYQRARRTGSGNPSMTIRTLLVDDEKLAIQGLQLRLEPYSDVEIIGTCANGREAIRAIKTEKPDLVFLDIQRPGFDGFSVVKGVMEIEPPLFVFVTAYEEHAIRAFEANAVNYLMKPVDDDKLADTLDRVRTRLAEKRSAEEAKKLQDVLAEIAPDAIGNLPAEDDNTGRYERMINIKDRGQIFRVDVESIEHIDAAGDYMCIYTGDNSLILRETMKDLERRLDPRVFQRVHRSTIVNLDQVRQVKPHTNGECFLVLDSGAEVKVSRSYRDVVARFVH